MTKDGSLQHPGTQLLREESSGVPCPVCGSILIHIVARTNIPHFGTLIISTLKCKNCGYKNTCTFFETEKGPRRIERWIKGKEDLRLKIVRSPESTITIPQLGIEIVHKGEGEIVTVEGFLRRIYDNLSSFGYVDVAEKVREVLEGRLSIKIIIEDEKGISRFID